VAQDFYAAFKLGEGDTTINSVDADGVALAAIQGLNLLVSEQAAEIDALEGQVAALERRQEGPSAGEQAWAKAILLLGLLLAATSVLCACTLIEIRKLKGLLPSQEGQAGRRPQA
jgi:hypothetical protein